MVRRLVRASDAQALSEYGIVLAMLAGLRWLEDVGRGVADDPRWLWGLGVVFVLAVGSSLRRR